MIQTYLNAGVLIASVPGHPGPARSAYDLLEDPEREFVASVFLRLEVLPKANHQRSASEVAFYWRYFERVLGWIAPQEAILRPYDELSY